jgi:ankyrin repeat protein
MMSYAKFMHEAQDKFNCFDMHMGRSADGHTPLSYAIYAERLDIAEYILEQTCSVNCLTTHGYSPLHVAIIRNNMPAVRLLVRCGADVNQALVDTGIINAPHVLPLQLAVDRKRHAMVEYLTLTATVQAKIDQIKDFVPHFSFAALFWAIENTDLEILQWLYETGFDFNKEILDSDTALIRAIKTENAEVATWLLRHGAWPTVAAHTAAYEQRNKSSKDPLVRTGTISVGTHGARYTRAQQVLDTIEAWLAVNKMSLAQHLAYVDPTSQQTALTAAIKARDLVLIQNLIGAGANVDLKNGRDNTALDLAIARGYTVMAKMLVVMGADTQSLRNNPAELSDLLRFGVAIKTNLTIYRPCITAGHNVISVLGIDKDNQARFEALVKQKRLA